MEKLEARLGYTFRDRSLLENALMHSSYANERRAAGCTSYERLEFLGDSVLGMVTAEKLYKLFPELPEGRLSRLRAELVCEQSLHAVALGLQLGDYLLLGKGEEHTGGRERPSILADVVEAIIAAMYLDGGLEVARSFILERSSPESTRVSSTMSRTTRPNCRSAYSARPTSIWSMCSRESPAPTTTSALPWRYS